MDVFFETQSGSKFSIELGYWDTVLEIKKKIEKYQRIPVPTQTLFFEGKALQDNLDIGKCNILNNSRVIVYVDHDPNHNNDQVVQTEQSLVPSNSIGDLIYGEDLPLTTEDILKIRPFYPVHDEIIHVQGSPVRNNEQSPVINSHQDSTVTSQGLQTEQSPPSNSVKENINIQDSSVEVRNNDQSPAISGHDQDSTVTSQDLQNEQSPAINSHQDSTVTSQDLQTEQSPPSNSVKENINIQDSSVEVRNNDQSPAISGHDQDSTVTSQDLQNEQSPAINSHQDSTVTSQDLQTEKSPPSNSVKENINIQDSSVEVKIDRPMRVYVRRKKRGSDGAGRKK